MQEFMVDLFNLSGETFEISDKARLSKETAQVKMIGMNVLYWIDPYPQS
jgi:hypothetical protein